MVEEVGWKTRSRLLGTAPQEIRQVRVSKRRNDLGEGPSSRYALCSIPDSALKDRNNRLYSLES